MEAKDSPPHPKIWWKRRCGAGCPFSRCSVAPQLYKRCPSSISGKGRRRLWSLCLGSTASSAQDEQPVVTLGCP